MRALLAHPGTQSSFRLAIELERRGTLSAFHTGFAFRAGTWADRAWGALPAMWWRRLANRRIEGLPAGRLRCQPAGELRALLRLRGDRDAQTIIHRRNEAFQRGIPDRDITSAQAVIGFDTSAWVLADRCARYEMPLVLSQTTCHPDAKLRVHKWMTQNFPGWVEEGESRHTEVRDAEEREYKGATLIVASSSFTKQTLVDNGVPPAKIRINPYGVNCDNFFLADGDKARPFRFVFVGAVNAYKGIPLLLEAWRKLAAQSAELWIVGPVSQRILTLIHKLPGLRYVGELTHAELPTMLQQCDAFVFPSYFEGFGKVILEAMASGLPVLTTTATAGRDIISHGQDGWVVEPGDAEGLVEIMEYCLAHRSAVREMGVRARATAEQYTWAEYGRRWVEILTSLEQI